MSIAALHESPATDDRVTRNATLAAGNKASYPGLGPCRIGQIVERVVEGRVIVFYHLTMLDDTDGELFVPVEKAHEIGLRLLMTTTEIPKVLQHLKKAVRTSDDWKQRASDNLRLFTTGSAFDLAEVVASLTGRGKTRSLTPRESRMLEKARRLLVYEISEVMGETRTEAAEHLDQALI
jgi:RNA polymerase-interacting CarD/CdnL/TRCF family regulator